MHDFNGNFLCVEHGHRAKSRDTHALKRNAMNRYFLDIALVDDPDARKHTRKLCRDEITPLPLGTQKVLRPLTPVGYGHQGHLLV